MFVYMFGVTNRRFGPAPGGEASDITLSRRTANWRSLVRHRSGEKTGRRFTPTNINCLGVVPNSTL